MKKNFLYRIEGFSPPSKRGQVSGYGFNISLDRDFAKKAFQTEIPEKAYENLQKIAKSIIMSGIDYDPMIRTPYVFVPNKDKQLTCLLQYCTVPGNACDMGLDWSEINDLSFKNHFSNYITYTPHNIDHHNQANLLLSIWLNWFDGAEAFLK